MLATLGLGSLTAAGGVVWSRQESRLPLDPIPPGGRIVVIGAGSASIAAVEKLTAAGYSIDWIEARDRVGGRTHTEQLGKVPMDMGAAWLHDGAANYLRARAEASPLEIFPTDFNNGVIQYQGELVPIDGAEVIRDFEASAVGPFVRHGLRSALTIPAAQPSIDSLLSTVAAKHGAQGAFGTSLVTANMGAPLTDVSMVVLMSSGGPGGDDGYDPFPTNDAMIEGGPCGLLTSFIGDLKPTLGETVESITRTASGIVVKSKRRSIEADAVILTIPLALLKKNTIRIEPSLSTVQQAALGRMSSGREMKVFLEYPENAWDSSHHLVGQCDSPYFDFFINLRAVDGVPGIMALSAGHKMEAAEAESDSMLAEALHQDVRAVFGPSIPEPLAHGVSNFSQDPLSQCCWSNLGLNALGNERFILQQPIGGRILLAGEGLSDRSGTFDGAWNDGQRAAQAIIDAA